MVLLRNVAFLFVVLLPLSQSRTVSQPHKRSNQCFGDLGCFSNDAPFFSLYRPLSYLPQSPEHIDTKFTLFTRQSPTHGHVLHADDTAGLTLSTFQASRPTKFIVHGFTDNGGVVWMSDIKDELLKQGDYNVVIVDWGHGSMALYGQASANTRVVGAQIAQLIKFLQANTEARPEDMHIIGHSLGSHVAGYAGERLQYLGRITGLDPAQPFFEHMDKAVRLDPTDALFVDVIHTDGDRFYSTDFGLGMDEPCGHVDYFPNGGHDQPGCEADPITHWAHEGLIAGTSEFVACNHLRSYHFFNETINSVCPFEAYRCDSEDDFNSGKCVPCSGEACGFMGLHADRTKPAGGATNVKYYLKTGTSWPYCRYHYKVSLDFAASSNGYESEERGQMFVHLTGSTGQTHTVQVTDSSVYFKSGQTYTYLLTSPTDLGDIHDVTLRWHHASAVLDVGSWNLLGLRHPQLAIDAVHVSSGETHTTFNFCEHGTSVETDHSQVFSRKC